MNSILKLKWVWYIPITVVFNALIVTVILFGIDIGPIFIHLLLIEFVTGIIIALLNIFFSKKDVIHRIAIGIATGAIVSAILSVVCLLYLFSGKVC